jgi:hypothetical protein
MGRPEEECGRVLYRDGRCSQIGDDDPKKGSQHVLSWGTHSAIEISFPEEEFG